MGETAWRNPGAHSALFHPSDGMFGQETHHEAAEEQRGSAASSGALHGWTGLGLFLQVLLPAAGQMPVWWAWS